jgi:uncharacterized protein
VIKEIQEEVQAVLAQDTNGHGMLHVMNVYRLSMLLWDEERQGRKEVVALAALLHDVDDYKIVGQEAADGLHNARTILDKVNVDGDLKSEVLDIISNMGYSKRMKGIHPKSIEGKIVSDADMLDSCGTQGIVRTLSFRVASGSGVIFNPDIFPAENLSVEKYKNTKRHDDSFINHHFDKLLKLKNLMFTEAGKKEALKRHKIMVDFLREFFREQGLQNWMDYLEEFEKKNK